MGWKLKRLKQCDKCPWKVSTDPYAIPNGYDVDKHKALKSTITDPEHPLRAVNAMSCHEHGPEDETHCVGWLVNQLGHGNNIPLRLKMLDCDNAAGIKLDGAQHERFEDTIPEPK